jgi:hypothetical protein
MGKRIAGNACGRRHRGLSQVTVALKFHAIGKYRRLSGLYHQTEMISII